jgi:hypothetical protein
MVLSEVAGIPGDSGSPIVARVDGKLVVIGIVSTTDGRWTWSCNSSSFVQFLSQKAPDVIDDQPNRGAFDLIPFPFLLVVLAGIGIVVLFMAGKK